MKKVTLILGAFLTLFMVSCEVNGVDGRDGFDGIDGIDGRDGLDGLDGQDAPLPKVIDVEGTFTLDNDYGIRHTFDDSIEVLETDVVLVYLLWDQADGSDGQPIDIWRLLPQTRLLDQGVLIYNFEHTFVDVDIFLEADFDLGTLAAGDTDNQVFRIAVLPAESTSGKSSVDKTSITSVMAYLGVEDKDVKKVQLK
ncbi:collagen-like protein [Maribacter sp. 2308TA10-17]|uniref:collagen-like protein n=1 Tax=Maribacter sp. 2308TA10-17 TaxID=3386276 RepID=UPI0039BCD8C3